MTRSFPLWRALAWSACGFLPLAAFAAPEPGLIYVHTARGSVTAQSTPTGPATPVAPGDSFPAIGQIITVPEAQPLVLILSNGAGLCMPTGGRLTLDSFTQEPVADTSIDADYEPSTSQLKLALAQGSLALAMRTPRPTSTLNISTPLAQLSCLSRSLVVIATPDEVSIAVFDGTVGLTVPSTGFAETLQTGQYVTLDRASLTEKYPLKLAAISLVQQQEYGAWLDMARWAAARVVFIRADQSLHPHLVIPFEFTQGISVEEPRFRQ